MARGSDERIFHGGISENSVTASGAGRASSEERCFVGGGYGVLRNVLAVAFASHFLWRPFLNVQKFHYTFLTS